MPAHLVAGLAFGDEGKGATTEALVREYKAELVIRYNGGAQAAHNVVLPDGRHHTFAQFGSGTFVPGVRTFLSRFVLVNPIGMMIEAEVLEKKGVTDALQRTTVDPRALVITVFHRTLNRLREISRATDRHGSTGKGIGTTREMHLKYGDAMLLVGDLSDSKVAYEKLNAIKEICKAEISGLELDSTDPVVQQELGIIKADTTIPWYLKRYEEWSASGVSVDRCPFLTFYDPDSAIIFEGAQGMLLDETHGFQPHTTWTDITFANAFSILQEMQYQGSIHKIGVLRSYFTRHGDGPFPSEDASVLRNNQHFAEKHNKSEQYTGDFRVGAFDIPLALYALKCIGGVDQIALNHMDVLKYLMKVPVRVSKSDTIGVKQSDFRPMVEEILNVPVGIESYGPTYKDRIFKEIFNEGYLCLHTL